MITRRLGAALAGAAFVPALLATGAAPAAAAPIGSAHISLVRGAAGNTVTFDTTRSGESLLDLTAAAPGADWGRAGAESAVVSLSVDGKYQSDIVIPSARPIAREFALGGLAAGRHTLRFKFAGDRTPAGVRRAVLTDLKVRTVPADDPDHEFLRFAPVIYGRNLADYGGQYASSFTDAPLVAWHESVPAATPGHRTLTYSVIWSNEDGGTNTPALMARWGRTTDIEWVYSVEIDADGNRVPGSDTYQGASHVTQHFTGTYEGDHALIETCTSNNNICDKVTDPMRFALSYEETLPAGLPREAVMDAHPWTYQVTAEEMLREGKIENPADPATAEVSDERNYLFLTVTKNQVPVGDTTSGVSVEVTLKGSPAVYRSDHLGTGGDPTWSLTRDVPASCTVELPAGTTADDIATIKLVRVPIGVDSGATVHATAVTRGFFLGSDRLPQAGFLDWHGSADLTPSNPTATVHTG